MKIAQIAPLMESVPPRLQRQLLALGGHRGAADREIRSAPAAGRGDLSRMARLPFLHRWRPIVIVEPGSLRIVAVIPA